MVEGGRGGMLAAIWWPNCTMRLGLTLGPALEKKKWDSTQPGVTTHEIFLKNQAENIPTP